ncbi:MAG: hypothetical protein P8M32_09450 [Phycisphaerales bacterium]|nr:hypothetical protein [Phycisphaerales bacterium]
MSSCCPLCSSVNQLSIDSATLCMECATVATPAFTIPIGFMVLGGATIAVAFMCIKRLRSMRRFVAA